MRFVDLSGQKFGRLTVIGRAQNKGNKTMWLCKCDCGNETVVAGGNLKNSHTQSCGCFGDESRVETHTTHGMSETKLYSTWLSRKRRCFSPEYPAYHNYGGRGISMCDEWKNDFGAFYRDVSKLPHFEEEGYSLERIDNDGDYEPSNCKWATHKEQANNRRSNILITYNNKKQTLKQWTDELGLDYKKIRRRITALHWTAERAFNTK